MRQRQPVIWGVRWLARIGYGARGLVYLIFGALALETAFTLSAAHDARDSLGVVQSGAVCWC